MATEKKLDVRFQLRTDTKANWDDKTTAGLGGNLVLKKGEAGVYAIPADTATSQEAATMLKIGNGTGAFKDLPWLSALAADVYPWAKEPSIAVESDSSTGNVITSISWDESGNDGKGRIYCTKGITALTSHQSIKNFYANNTNSLVPSAVPEEIAGSGTINLHRISKTGKYSDLIGTPTIGDGEITVNQNGVGKGTFTLNQTDGLTISLTDTNYQLANSGTTLKLQSKTSGSFADVTGQSFNLATILANTFVNTSGDTMIGALTLSGAPTADLHAATKKYVDETVANTVSGAAQFIGTFGSDSELSALKFNSTGDFARCSTTYNSAWYGTIHAADIAVVTDNTKTAATGAYSIVHGETYTMNSATADGYVAKGSGNANKVWKTDASGNPAWRDDKDTNTAHSHTAGAGLVVTGNGGISGTTTYKAKLKNESTATTTAENIGGVVLHPVILDNEGDLSVRIPNKQFRILPNDDSVFRDSPANETIEFSFPQATEATVSTSSELLVSRFVINFKDIVSKNLDTGTAWNADNNHVPTTLAVKNAIESHGGIDKVGTVTSVSAGTGLKVTGTATVNPKIEFDDSVIFVLNGGTATTVI